MADENEKKNHTADLEAAANAGETDREAAVQPTKQADASADDDAGADPAEKETPDAEEHRDFLSARDARATGEHYRMTPAEEKSRKRRSIAIALGIVAFVALVYLITMLRLAENVGA